MGLPWFDTPLARLREAVGRNALPHAVLVAIPPGWGSEQLLSALVVEILGRAPRDGQALAEFADPDFTWVRSLDKDGDVSINIQVDAVRVLNDFVTTRPSLGRYKLAIIPDAHRMNLAAANALLKTLEEPVSNTCLVLETSQPGSLLPTLRSRCQRLPLRFSRELAERWLTESGHADAISLLDSVGGAPLAAVELARQPEHGIERFLDALRQPASRNAALDQLARHAELVDLLRHWYRVAGRRLANSSSRAQQAAILQFTDELVASARQVDVVKGANIRLLLDRLAFLWVIADGA